MRSPCFDCKLRDADKNGEECLRCDARVKYIQSLAEDDAGSGFGGNVIEIKKEVRMGLKGTCNNCERENMSLPSRGFCGLCDRFWRNAPVDGKMAALAAAKERVTKGTLYAPFKKKKIKQAKEKASPEKQNIEPAEVPSRVSPFSYPLDVMHLEFKSERDKELLDWLVSFSVECRREPQQQLLCILTRHMDFHKSREFKAAEDKASSLGLKSVREILCEQGENYPEP